MKEKKNIICCQDPKADCSKMEAEQSILYDERKRMGVLFICEGL